MSQGKPLNNQKQQPSSLQNYLETLRNQSPYDSSVSRPSFFESAPRQKAEVAQRRIAEFHHARQAEWRQVYSAKDKERARQIEDIRQQLAKLAKNVEKLHKNIGLAVFTPMPQVGEYHKTFLDHIRDLIELINDEVVEANSWIKHYRQRSKKQGHYWNLASQKGASYTQNNERQVATSIG